MNKEFKFLEIINNNLDDSSYLGDDCAYLEKYGLVVSSDTLIEDVHFSLNYMSAFEIAQKALLVNISDIIASGGKIEYATINLSGKLTEEFVKDFYKGINETVKEYNLKIIGGDLTYADKITVSITVFGSCENRNISSRKNAKANYIVATMGEFGSSAMGLKELKENKKESYFTNFHKKPKLYPEIAEQIALKTKYPYAMMDSSDGLYDCLYQISKKSNVGIKINYDLIETSVNDKDMVLFGGEDYSLVMCLKEEDFEKIKGIKQIGMCTSDLGLYIDNEEIEYKGFKHFD